MMIFTPRRPKASSPCTGTNGCIAEEDFVYVENQGRLWSCFKESFFFFPWLHFFCFPLFHLDADTISYDIFLAISSIVDLDSIGVVGAAKERVP